MNTVVARLRDISAMLLIGDGVAALVAPKARPDIWLGGPPPWRNLMQMFERHPRAVMALGVVEVLIGVAMMRGVASEYEDDLDAHTLEPVSGPGAHG